MPTSCASCVPGFFQKGWKCKNLTYVSFSFVLAANISAVLADIDNIKLAIYNMLASTANVTSNVTDISTVDTSMIDIEDITTGSTVLAGSASPISGSVADASAAISSGTSGGLAGFSVTSSQVAVQTEGATSSSE